MADLAALTWPLPVGRVVVVELLERAQVRVAVINILLEGGVAHATDMLPVSAWQMAHGAPSVHLIAVASRHGHRAEQRGHNDASHDRCVVYNVPGCCRLAIPSCKKAGSWWEIAPAVEVLKSRPGTKTVANAMAAPSPLISVKQSRNVTLPPLDMRTVAVCRASGVLEVYLLPCSP